MVWFSCVFVGFIWGLSNNLLKRFSEGISKTSDGSILEDFVFLASRWKYLLSLLLNLSGSVMFNLLLKDNEVSYIVPVVNGITFFSTSLFGLLFGERLGKNEWIGLGLIIVGVYIMMS